MKRSAWIGCWIVVFAQTIAVAQNYEVRPTAEPPLAPPPTSAAGQFMTMPDFEVFSPELPGAEPMVPSYTLPSHQYSGWYRPRAIERDKSVRCGVDTFHPRGFGRLFAKPCGGRRVDYKPFGLDDWGTKYGPAYYQLAEDPRCDNCDHSAGHCGGGHSLFGHGVGCGLAGCGLGGGLGWGLFAGGCGHSGCTACGDDCGNDQTAVLLPRRRRVHRITRRRAIDCAEGCAR